MRCRIASWTRRCGSHQVGGYRLRPAVIEMAGGRRVREKCWYTEALSVCASSTPVFSGRCSPWSSRATEVSQPGFKGGPIALRTPAQLAHHAYVQGESLAIGDDKDSPTEWLHR